MENDVIPAPPVDESASYSTVPVQSEGQVIHNRLAEFSLAVVVSLATAFLLWYFFVRPRKKTNTNIVSSTKFPWLLVMVAEIVYVGVSLMAGAFAFALFFSDHQPFPGPLNNLRFFVTVEIVILLLFHLWSLRCLQNWQRQWGVPIRVQKVLLVLNLLVVALTILLPVVTVIFGD